ncbi:MAG: asparagine synthase [Deltaproteobacteria bacterium]|nr:MAG: asparagine synthase [Deltaproteobacteria bacterium]
MVTPTPEDFRRLYPQIVWHLDQPVATASSIAEFALARMAREHVTVVLGGQGADELFGGYIRYLLMLEEERLAKMAQLESYQPLMRYFWSPEMFKDPAERYFHLIRRTHATDAGLDRVKAFFAPFTHRIDQMGYCDIQTTLPSLITMNDRGAAAVGLENRSPFLDHRIVEFAFRLPPELKVSPDFETKSILRKAARGLVPEVVRQRKDKKGLVVPFHRWLHHDLRAWAETHLAALRRRNVEIHEENARGAFDRQRYALVTLELWFRAFIDSQHHELSSDLLAERSTRLRNIALKEGG